jgi:hypothetical protein
MGGTFCCTRHRREAAAWRCQGCGASLCPACAYAIGPAEDAAIACAGCGALAEPLRVHRAEIEGLAVRLSRAPAFLFRRGTAASIAAAAIVTAALSYFGLLGALLAYGVAWAFTFSTIRSAAHGRPGIELPDFTDAFEDIGLPAIRGAVATAILWVPAVAYALFTYGRSPHGALLALVRDPVAWLILATSIAYAPIAVLVAATGGGLLRMLNPLLVAIAARRLGRAYLLTLVFVCGCFVAGVGLAIAGEAVRALPVPLVSRWAAEFIELLPLVLMGHALGLLLHVHGDRLGYGLDTDYLVPVAPGARPTGTRPRADDAPLPTNAVRPASLAREIGRAIAGRDAASALELYERYGAEPCALTPEQHFEIARVAAGASRDVLAVAALRAAASAAGDPIAPRAMLALGRIHARRLGEPDQARDVFALLVERYPETPAAEAARRELAS